MNTNWHELKKQVYFEDRSFRDIYVFNINLDDWKKWCDFVNQKYEIEFIDKENDKKENSIDFAEIEKNWTEENQFAKLATIKVGKININCHFFVAEEFENDILPKEFESIEDHKIFTEYLMSISEIFDRRVYVTCENSPDLVLLEVFK